MTRKYTPGPRQAKAEIPVLDAEYIEQKPTQRRRYVDAGWLLGLGIVACVSGMVALVMLAGGMW